MSPQYRRGLFNGNFAIARTTMKRTAIDNNSNNNDNNNNMVGKRALTVIIPSLIVFLFRMTIPIGFVMNFFGMTLNLLLTNEITL